MRHWKVQIKECGNNHILTPELVGDYDEQYCIEFFGLDEPDVEWYKLEEVTN